MPRVYNWQIGREMEYPYEGTRPAKQFAMVTDLNKCIAYQTYTIACKTTWTSGRGQKTMFWHSNRNEALGYYPLRLGRPHPRKLGVQEIDGEEYKGRTVFEAAPDGESVVGYLPDDLDYANRTWARTIRPG